MPTTALQDVRDQAIIAGCLADAIERSGLEHLCGGLGATRSGVLYDLSSVRATATQAKSDAAAAQTRAVALRIRVTARSDSCSARLERTRVRIDAEDQANQPQRLRGPDVPPAI